MIDVSLRIRDGEDDIHVTTMAELDRVLHQAGEEARAQAILSTIFLDAANGNVLSLVVGGDETVLTFTYGHLDPPYYASRGAAADPLPVMTCYVGLSHHTEFPRIYVVPYASGLVAAHEFVESGALPPSMQWVET
jgi:hypothetical protein